jgi:hypothetical protein
LLSPERHAIIIAWRFSFEAIMFWNIISFMLGYTACYVMASVLGLANVARWQMRAESTTAHLLAMFIENAMFAKEYKIKTLMESNAPKSLITITENDEDFTFMEWKKNTINVINEAYEKNLVHIRFHDWQNLLNYYEERWKNEHRSQR